MGDTLPLRQSSRPPPSSATADKWEQAGVKKGDVLAGRYRVDDVIGIGGMGAVLATTHVQMGSKCAIKLVRPQPGMKFVAERFVREARAASKLQSPHAVRVFDVGRLDSGTPYMVMEFLEGHDLKELLAKKGMIEPAMAADCVVQACKALSEAHALGIVHRDVKPANLFLVTRGPQAGMVKVLDFGISKFLMAETAEDAAPLTNPETTLGSPKYMAPEQLVRPNEVDVRADVWSLGVTLYELMIGKPPFRGTSDEYIARAVMVEFPIPPSIANANIPETLSHVVMRCLEKDKNARYATAAALAAAIEHATGEVGARGVPETIRDPSMPPMPLPLTPSAPPPAMPAATMPPPPRESMPASMPMPMSMLEPEKKRGWLVPLAVGVFAMVLLGLGGTWLVVHESHPEHVAVTLPSASSSSSSSSVATPIPTTSNNAPLATVAADTPPVSSMAPLKNQTTVTQSSGGPAPDPLCYAANIVCKRSYPECQSLRDYCDGKTTHAVIADAGVAPPGESPICTAARIVCDNKLEECDSLTKKCLVAQLQPNP